MQTYLSAAGVYLPDYATDEVSVAKALKQIDERFILWPPDGESPYYRVLVRISDWQDAQVVATCMDERGNPLPLSSRFVDQVNRLRLDAPNKGVSVDEFNARREEAIARDKESRGQAVMDDHRAKFERGRVSVGMGALQKKRSWQRRTLPGSN